jgi:hypothetical protein
MIHVPPQFGAGHGSPLQVRDEGATARQGPPFSTMIQIQIKSTRQLQF